NCQFALALRYQSDTQPEEKPVGGNRRTRSEEEDNAVLGSDDVLEHVTEEVLDRAEPCTRSDHVARPNRRLPPSFVPRPEPEETVDQLLAGRNVRTPSRQHAQVRKRAFQPLQMQL